MDLFPGMIDVWGQLPRMKGYTHLAACFSHPDNLPRETITAHLESATHQITSALPWIGGKVITIDQSPGCTGTFTVAPSTLTQNILKFKDRTGQCPSFEEIQQSKASSGQLCGPLLSEESAMPDKYTETEDCPAPVLTLTASWVKGGIILDCAAQHNILDIGGIDQFFQLLAAALRGDPLDQNTIEVNLADRRTIFPLLESNETRYDHSAMRCSSSFAPAKGPSHPEGPKPAFHYFRFSATSLSNLASLAQTPSIDDALSAFIWQRLSQVRGQDQDANSVTGLSRAIDCRRTLDVPKEYMGVVVVKTYSKMTFQEMDRSSLIDIAAQLRQDVRRVREQHFLRSLATLIAEEPDKSTISFVSGFNPDTWINASSWAGASMHTLDYGVLGRPAFVRRPESKPVQSLLYFLPMIDNGDINVLLCLKESEIDGLCNDVEWNKYAEYIG